MRAKNLEKFSQFLGLSRIFDADARDFEKFSMIGTLKIFDVDARSGLRQNYIFFELSRNFIFFELSRNFDACSRDLAKFFDFSDLEKFSMRLIFRKH